MEQSEATLHSLLTPQDQAIPKSKDHSEKDHSRQSSGTTHMVRKVCARVRSRRMEDDSIGAGIILTVRK